MQLRNLLPESPPASWASLAICVLFIPSVILSDTPSPKAVLGRWAKNLKIVPNMDARGVKLYGSEFVGQDLRKARFDHCALYGVRFFDCDLTNASFRGAILAGASFDDCRMDNADFTDAVINDMGSPSVTLAPEQLMSTYSYKKKDLRGVRISGMPSKRTGEPPEYDFRRADLCGASLGAGDFTRCDFTDAMMSGVQVSGIVSFRALALSKTFHVWKNLQEMTFASPYFVDECDFSGMDLTGAWLSDLHNRKTDEDLPLNLAGAIIRSAEFRKSFSARDYLTPAHLYSTASYKQGDLSGVKLYGFDLTGWDFSKQNLTGAAFGECKLAGADFTDAVISGVDFAHRREASAGLTVEQIKSTWNYKQGRMEGIILPEDVAQVLAAE